jgi:Domain of unknown function (DUF4349)
MEGKMIKVARKTKHVLFLVTIASLMLASCASAMSTPQSSPEMAPPAQGDRTGIGFPLGSPAQNESGAGGELAQTGAERLVIKDADLTLVVTDPAESMDRISAMADEMGGFVVTANLYQQQLDSGVEVPRADITIRVPAERLSEALARIRKESDQLPRNETLNSQDVTKEYTDLQSRLRNLEDAEAQLRDIMESATKTEDVLAVYNQLVQTREQIEVIKGQIQYYEQSAALSAISTSLIANEAAKPLTIGGWQPGGVAKNAIQSLISAFKNIVNAAIWVILFVLPVLLLLFGIFVLPAYLILRAWRRRRKAQKQAQAPTKPDEPDQPAS